LAEKKKAQFAEFPKSNEVGGLESAKCERTDRGFLPAMQDADLIMAMCRERERAK
jgi:hypothetical protein